MCQSENLLQKIHSKEVSEDLKTAKILKLIYYVKPVD